MKFQNRTALITGGTGNIGRATCELLSSLGVQIAVTDLDCAKANDFAATLNASGGRAIGRRMDVTDSRSVQEAVEQTVASFGKIDILINNAGIWQRHDAQHTSLRNTPESAWKQIIEINLCGVFRVTQAVLQPMQNSGYGRIINLGSIAGEVGLPGYCDYAAAKGGVILMTKSLAMELAREHITVNCVSPGMISATPGKTAPSDGTWVGRTGDAREVAELIAFLASDDASFITGVDYTIDGGRVLGPHNSTFDHIQ